MKAKHSILIALIVNLIIRIPRMLYAQGLDGFLGIWEAQLILNGEYFKNGFNFFTLLGWTPYSGYPIGYLLMLCLFLLIAGKNVMISILLYDLVFTVIFVISVYFLSSELEIKKSAKLYFILILTTLPNIFTFSYYTPSARYPFIALLPLVLALLLKFNKKRKIVNLFIALFISVILNFFHRIAFILFGVIFISVLIFIFERILKRDFLTTFHNKELNLNNADDENSAINSSAKKKLFSFVNYLKQRFWIFSILGLFTIGYIVFGTDFRDVFYKAKFNIYCFLKAIIDSEIAYTFVQPIIDQWFHYGIPFLLFILSLIVMFIPKFKNSLDSINKKPSNLKLMFFVLPFVLVYQIIYAYYFLCYIIALVSTLFLQNIEDKRYRHYIWPVFGLIVGLFITVYHFVTATKVLPYLIIGIFTLVISTIAIVLLSIKRTKKWLSANIGQFYNKRKLFVIFFFGILIFNNMFIVDRGAKFTNKYQSVYGHITEEERDIAEFLIQNGIGTFDSFDITVSTHIAALSGWYYLQDWHNRGAFLLENRNVDDISCQLTPIIMWFSLNFVNCTNTNGNQILYQQILAVECQAISVIILLKKYNIKYFISSRHTNSSSAWEYTLSSVFIQSLYSHVPVVKTTDNYNVWNTTTLFS